MSQELTDEQLRSIYAWVDAIPLSRPKRNIARDFSDGVLLAEVVAAYFPDLVELHNYSPASSTQQKLYNLESLNNRVLRKIGFQLTKTQIEDIVGCRTGAVEYVLNSLQFKMAKYREKRARSQSGSPNSRNGDQNHSVAPTPVQERQAAPPRPVLSDKKKPASESPAPNSNSKAPKPNNIKSVANDELLQEKEERIKELEERVEILTLKISKLEQLVRLKDNKIQKLTQQNA
jgi:hypothetical protein